MQESHQRSPAGWGAVLLAGAGCRDWHQQEQQERAWTGGRYAAMEGEIVCLIIEMVRGYWS